MTPGAFISLLREYISIVEPCTYRRAEVLVRFYSTHQNIEMLTHVNAIIFELIDKRKLYSEKNIVRVEMETLPNPNSATADRTIIRIQEHWTNRKDTRWEKRAENQKQRL